MATFETSMYDERGRKRTDFGLADVFGVHKAGDVIGTNGNAYCARIERNHDILSGFVNRTGLRAPSIEFRSPRLFLLC